MLFVEKLGSPLIKSLLYLECLSSAALGNAEALSSIPNFLYPFASSSLKIIIVKSYICKHLLGVSAYYIAFGSRLFKMSDVIGFLLLRSLAIFFDVNSLEVATLCLLKLSFFIQDETLPKFYVFLKLEFPNLSILDSRSSEL